MLITEPVIRTMLESEISNSKLTSCELLYSIFPMLINEVVAPVMFRILLWLMVTTIDILS